MVQQNKRQTETSDAEALRGHVALKGFFNICHEWGCSQEEMTQMLGGISRSTLSKYQKLPYIKLSRDTLERISYIMGDLQVTESNVPDGGARQSPSSAANQ